LRYTNILNNNNNNNNNIPAIISSTAKGAKGKRDCSIATGY